MSQVVIGMDPHKRSATIEVMAGDERVVGGGRYAADATGCRVMLAGARRWPQRMWAVEGCRGIGRHLASRLLADGGQVAGVPAKLSARARVSATGQGRTTDATGAHSVALAAAGMKGLRPAADDAQLAVPPIVAGRRRSLGEDHTRMISQLHRLLLELIPGGAKTSLSAAQAKALLARIHPRDAAGKARRRAAAELVSGLERIYQRKKAADQELTALLTSTRTTLTARHRIGPSSARLLAEAAGVTRSPTTAHIASQNGTAPAGAPPATRSATACPGQATARSTASCTSWPWSSSATPPKAAPATTAGPPPAKHPWKRCAPSHAGSPASPAAR